MRWLAFENSKNEIEDTVESEDGNVAHGKSGLCRAWKSAKPGSTEILPSRGGYCGVEDISGCSESSSTLGAFQDIIMLSVRNMFVRSDMSFPGLYIGD